MWAINLEELKRAVSFTQPSAIFVPARVLRRVIKRDRGLGFFEGAGSRQSSYVISSQRVRAIGAAEELGISTAGPGPTRVVLVAEPEEDEPEGMSPGLLLKEYWRRLFRSRVEAAVRDASESGRIDAEGLACRLDAIGPNAFEEARAVLTADGLLAAGASDAEAYAAFASAFLDPMIFSPSNLGGLFPAVESPEAVRGLLAHDLDVEALLQATRPAGAMMNPASKIGLMATEEETEGASSGLWTVQAGEVGGDAATMTRRVRRLEGQASAAEERGNSVRAAILWAQAARAKGTGLGESSRVSARAALRHLANRLQKALFVRKGEAELWAEALTPLLRLASRGFWSAEARLLYDLQKVCLDHEGEVFRLDLLGWAFSLGRRPLKRPMPQLREVTMSSHLLKAAGRLPKVRLGREERSRLESLLRPAVRREEVALRERFRPVIKSILETYYVQPSNLPERVSFGKLEEELLDKVVGQGFTTLGDFRDAASRSNLKLPDLTGAAELIKGDRLLRTDRALAVGMEGVHRRGEVYLRALQRFSSLAFGTPFGRFLTLFLALPFGGAFVLLKGLQEIDELLISHLTGTHIHVVNPWSILVLGAVALGAINYSRFRNEFLNVATLTWRLIRTLVIDVPAWLWKNPLVRRILRSPLVLWLWRLLLKPALAASPIGIFAWLAGASTSTTRVAWAGGTLTACFAINTKTGRELEEAVVDFLGRSARLLVFEVLPGLFRVIMSAFERILDWIEKAIYAVDEWLRFRKGQSRAVLALKAALGLVWGVVAYFVRIYVNLLIEPQVNPIKHFPVVTVSHKVMLPLALKLTILLGAFLTPLLGKDLGIFVAAANVLLFPGVFGFLVWELKSNWRLYERNRPANLTPVVVGSHGETMVGLLQPGFHSGTLPKLFAKLRAARREGNEKVALKRRDALHHVEEAVRRFVERDLVELLRESRSLGNANIEPGAIRLATNQVRVELLSKGGDRPSLWVVLHEREGTLTAEISRPGWLDLLGAEERQTLSLALAGFFMMSGAQPVHAAGEPGMVSVAGDLESKPLVIPWVQWVAAWEREGGKVVEPEEVPWASGIVREPVSL